MGDEGVGRYLGLLPFSTVLEKGWVNTLGHALRTESNWGGVHPMVAKLCRPRRRHANGTWSCRDGLGVRCYLR